MWKDRAMRAEETLDKEQTRNRGGQDRALTSRAGGTCWDGEGRKYGT